MTLSYNCHLLATSEAILNAGTPFLQFLETLQLVFSVSSQSFLHGTQVNMNLVVSFPCSFPVFACDEEKLLSWTKYLPVLSAFLWIFILLPPTGVLTKVVRTEELAVREVLFQLDTSPHPYFTCVFEKL